ncbi:phage tail tape measure C-terminal domain-containing protein [Profundibacter sp.]
MAEKRVSVRIDATGGKRVRAEFRGIGEEGRRSFSMVGREADNLNRRLVGIGRGAGGARYALRNMGLQLNQVAQQGSVTGDYMRALSIQMPDLLLGFGGLGIALGIVAGAFGPLLLEMIGAVDKGKELEKSINNLGESVDAYASKADLAGAPTEKLARKYGNLAGEARSLLMVQRDLAKLEALDSISKGLTAAREALGDIGTVTSTEFQEAASKVAELKAELEELRSEQKAILSEGLDIGDNAFKNIQLQGRITEIRDSLRALGDFTGPVNNLSSSLGIAAVDANNLAAAMADLRDAKGIEEQAIALERLREEYIAALGGVENMTVEQRTLLQQLTEAALATVKFRSTMDDATVSVGNTSAQATVLANELQRAAGNAMSLAAQSFNSLRESEIRLKYKDDPTGLAGALAGQRFDTSVGDVSGADPILQEGLRRQREAYVSNAEAIARNQQALAEWNRAQRSAAVGARATTKAIKEQATGLDAAKESLDAYIKKASDLGKGLGDSLVGAFRNAENAIGNFVRTGKLEFKSLVSSILADFAQLSARRFLLGPLAKALSGSLGGGGWLANVLHSGGMVGSGGQTRAVPALAFAGAPRMHSGGWAGLKPDEVPAILQKGERVLSRSEVAAGLGQSAPVNINIQTRDAESFRQSRAQIAADIARAVSLGRRGM